MTKNSWSNYSTDETRQDVASNILPLPRQIAPLAVPITGLEAFSLFMSRQLPVNGSTEIWLKLGHNQLLVSDEADPSGNFPIWTTKKLNNEPKSRVRKNRQDNAYQFIRQWSEQNDYGVFIIPTQPQGYPIAECIQVADDVAAELDEGTPDEQWQIISEFASAAGLEPNTITHSGSKSYHPRWKGSEHFPIEQTVKLRKLLAIALLSDPAIANPHQPMRIPGFYRKEKGKEQTLCYYSDARYSQQEFEEGFRRFFEYRGWQYPEQLSEDRWKRCYHVLKLKDKLSEQQYSELKSKGYALPEIIGEECNEEFTRKLLVLAESISPEIKISELREILSIPEEELITGSRLNEEELLELQKQQEIRRQKYRETGLVQTWYDFYKWEISPRLTRDTAFNQYSHGFIRNGSNRWDGDPGYRATSGSKSFTVQIYRGDIWFRDWALQKSGDPIKYRWWCKGGSGYPKGKDYVEIVKQLAVEVGVSIPECLENQQKKDAIAWKKKNQISADEWAIANLKNFFSGAIKRAKSIFKGFDKSSPKNAPVPQTKLNEGEISYQPGCIPENRDGEFAPSIVCQNSSELQQVYVELVQKGWKKNLVNATPGMGKSHSIDGIKPEMFYDQVVDEEGKIQHRIIYLSDKPGDPATAGIERLALLPARTHNDKIADPVKKTPLGNPVIRNVRPDGEEANQGSNCHRASMHRAARGKIENTRSKCKNSGERVSDSNPICRSCKYLDLCKSGSGMHGDLGFGFKAQMKEALANTSLRGHINSITPDLASGGILFLDDVTHDGFKQTKIDLEKVGRTSSRLYRDMTFVIYGYTVAILRAIDGYLSDRLYSEVKIASKWGMSLTEIREDILTILTEKELKLFRHFGVNKPDGLYKDTHDKLRYSIESGIEFNNLISIENDIENDKISAEEIAALPEYKWLSNFIDIILEQKEGSLNLTNKYLTVTTRDEEFLETMNSADAIFWLNASETRQSLAGKLNCSPDEIATVKIVPPSYEHLEIRVIEVPGLASKKNRSDRAKEKVTALIKTNASEVNGEHGAIDFLAYSGPGALAHFSGGRGSNAYEKLKALTVVGIPHSNLTYLQQIYEADSGSTVEIGRSREETDPQFQKFIDRSWQKEIEQEFHRLRPVRRIQEKLIVNWLVPPHTDSSFLEKMFPGAIIRHTDAFSVAPEAGTAEQRIAWGTLNFLKGYVTTQGKLPTQEEVAKELDIDRSRLSKLFKGGWRQLKKIVQSSYIDPYKGFAQFSEEVENQVRELLELPPMELAKVLVQQIAAKGWGGLIELVTGTIVATRFYLLGTLFGVLAGINNLIPDPGGLLTELGTS